MDLYSFFNSSTSYRVRIVLALKKLDYRFTAIDIRAKQHHNPAFLAKNPGAGVPLLTDEGFELGQSLAIIDYLDTKYPEPRLIPLELQPRARVLEMANLIASDMHPLNNLRVLRYLVNQMGVSHEQKDRWYAHWLHEGFVALEKLLERSHSGNYSVGEQVSLADCCLVPQVFNALRTRFDMEPFPRILAVYRHCSALPAFRDAEPGVQPDFDG